MWNSSKVFACKAIYVYAINRLSLNSSPNKIICSNFVYLHVEQAQTCLKVIWLTYYFPIYSKPMTKECFSPSQIYEVLLHIDCLCYE